jgi:hypothetical protein
VIAADPSAAARLEMSISAACAELSMAPSEDSQREVFARIQELHRQRSAEQILRLEQARGLRK